MTRRDRDRGMEAGFRVRLMLLMALCGLLLAATSACAVPFRKGASQAGIAIQVGAFSHLRNAELLTARLQARGIEAYYFRRDNGLYAVRFGDFASWDQAKWTARKLVVNQVIDAYFIVDPSVSPGISRERQPQISKEPQTPPASRAVGEMGYIAARTAERFVGIPYRWGGDTVVEGMDCSGFVRAVYNLCGVSIPRTSAEQFRAGDFVTRADLMDGDLVFFGDSPAKVNHVGIYIGDSRFVHAPRRGDDIKISTLDEGYFTKRFLGGRRYF